MRILFTVILLIPIGVLGQLGIKTKQHSAQNNQAYELYSLNHYQNVNHTAGGSVNYTYGAGSSNNINNYDMQYPPLHHGSGGRPQPYPGQPNSGSLVVVDKTVKFLNETRSKMASGVCYKEVKTVTLVSAGEIPKGNGSDPTLSKIRVCCDGYERNVHNFLQCDPICKNDCINGICVAPDVCVCYPDHVRNYAGYCLPTCPIGCGNGVCQDDGSCLCKPGYELDHFSKKFCAPVCSNGCRNGNCTAPEVCECSNGFELSDHGSCDPKCDNCENGKCIEPGVCTCLSGYQRKNDKCEPICTKECKNGFCAAPDICGCNPGWVLDASATNCVAHCDQPCLNGFCSGNNVCSCHTGYIQDEVNPNLCRPHCPGGCPNGFCTSPNYCICKAGFVKSGVKGRTQCTPV
ncbi:epidermal growth factor-like protein [Condylostylus longicornis]|uniref:epidermal growth factor-like protein n=1 Tax=Condylostylus longicornis TaxID=2530218 RepID=UPI00244DB5EF|nr:epidermal growth factor-like protein [Condylostylus longicornis]